MRNCHFHWTVTLGGARLAPGTCLSLSLGLVYHCPCLNRLNQNKSLDRQFLPFQVLGRVGQSLSASTRPELHHHITGKTVIIQGSQQNLTT